MNLIHFVNLLFLSCLISSCSQLGGSLGSKNKPIEIRTYSQVIESSNSGNAIYYYKTVKELSLPSWREYMETVDFIKFKASYLMAKKIDTSLIVPVELEELYSQYMGEGDTLNTIRSCTKILARDFTDINSHVVKAFSLRLLGKTDQAEYHSAMGDKLVESILQSGDGNSKETAYHVFQVKEEYDFLKSMHLEVVSQNVVRDSLRSFDVLECNTRTGEKLTLYFDITVHMNNLRQNYNRL